MAQTPLDLDVSFAPDGRITVVAPKQAGISWAEAAPRIADFCKALAVEYDAPVDLVDEAPEQHLHTPEGEAARVTFGQGAQRAHGHSH